MSHVGCVVEEVLELLGYGRCERYWLLERCEVVREV